MGIGAAAAASGRMHPIGARERITQESMLQAASAVQSGLPDSTLRRAQQGDAAAFADIVHEHQKMVFSIAYHFVNDPSVAEDLAQEAFLRLYRNLPSIESATHVIFWLRRVTSHCCFDWFRRKSHCEEVPIEQADDIVKLLTVRAPHISKDFLLEERLGRLVGQLPAPARLVVTLRYQEDLEPLEIAAILEMPVNTVKSHLHRSIEQLRTWLREAGAAR